MRKLTIITFLTLSIGVAAQVTAPTLTETETLKIQNFALRRQNLEFQAAAIREAQGKLDSEITAFLDAIKKSYPGYQLGANGLEKTPDSTTKSTPKKD